MRHDPRPYQAQLEQAQANRAKDQANLKNAQRSARRFSKTGRRSRAIRRRSIPPSERRLLQHPLSVLAFNGDDQQLSNRPFKLVDNQIDQTTGTVTLNSPTRMPHCGRASSSTHLVLRAVKNGVTIPAGAVQNLIVVLPSLYLLMAALSAYALARWRAIAAACFGVEQLLISQSLASYYTAQTKEQWRELASFVLSQPDCAEGPVHVFGDTANVCRDPKERGRRRPGLRSGALKQ